MSLILTLFLLTSCGGSDSKKSNKDDKIQQHHSEVIGEGSNTKSIEIPAIEYTYPEQEPVESYMKNILVKFQDKRLSSKEHITVSFNRYGSFKDRHLYLFNKSYLGKEDNSTFLFFGTEDDVFWNTPWKMISINLRSFTVFGGDEAGEGVPIGFIYHRTNGDLDLELFGDFNFDIKTRELKLESPKEQPILRVDCPGAVKTLKLCEVYSSLFNALGSIDFSAIGQAAPTVASNILSISTVFDIVKSVWFFEPSVDQIRDEYLIPVLSLIGDLKGLGQISVTPNDQYVQKTSEVYTDIIKVSVKTVLKTQRLMPEALNDVAGTGFGVVLAYLGAEGIGDSLIARKQPEWFKELVAPIIREIGILAIDLVANTSNTSLESRMIRFIELEAELKDTVRKLCESSDADKNQCLEALN